MKERKTNMTALPKSSVEALKLIAKTQFRPFDDADWQSWAGCESAEPMIAQIGEITVVIDGETVHFNQYHEDNGEPEWINYTLRFDGAY
jgi:hypothetical protein